MSEMKSARLPEPYLARMREILGSEYGDYLESFEEERTSGLRVNTLKISPEEFRKVSPFPLEPVPWTSNGFYCRAEDRPGKHPYYYAGLYYLQEPSAMAPAAVLPVEPGDRVLDLCAAPGGKSTELAAKLNGKGLLVSNDISNSRAQALLKNLELFGVKNALILSEDPVKLAPRFEGFFDRILIDAPCSGEGMFRKEPAVIRSWIEHGNEFYVSLQKSIVRSALQMLRPGGMLLYSTCTFCPDEDEEMVLYMKKICPGLHVVPIPERFPGFQPGRADLASEADPELSHCARLYPHKLKGEGHFLALLQKDPADNGDFPQNYSAVSEGRRRTPKLSSETLEFVEKLGIPGLAADRLILHGSRLLMPALNDEQLLSGLRILRNGLLLGEEKKSRFEPSQALSMALKKEEFPDTVDLPVSDERVLRYLKGETLNIPDFETAKDGDVLILAGGFPLGFGKKSGIRLKNKYLPGWRYQ